MKKPDSNVAQLSNEILANWDKDNPSLSPYQLSTYSCPEPTLKLTRKRKRKPKNK